MRTTAGKSVRTSASVSEPFHSCPIHLRQLTQSLHHEQEDDPNLESLGWDDVHCRFGDGRVKGVRVHSFGWGW